MSPFNFPALQPNPQQPQHNKQNRPATPSLAPIANPGGTPGALREFDKRMLKDKSAATFTIFAIIGGAILAVSIIVAVHTFQFVQTALPAKGKIVDVESHRGTKGSTTYAPVVEYLTSKNETVRFSSKMSTSSRPQINTTVDVLYNQLNPGDASINSLFDLWAFPFFFGGFGLIFLLVGTIPLGLKINKTTKGKQLKMTGQMAVTKISGIELTNTRINRVHGRRIITEYSQGGNTISFKSDPIYVWNIEQILRPGDEIDVYINPANPQSYYLDVENVRIKNG